MNAVTVYIYTVHTHPEKEKKYIWKWDLRVRCHRFAGKERGKRIKEEETENP